MALRSYLYLLCTLALPVSSVGCGDDSGGGRDTTTDEANADDDENTDGAEQGDDDSIDARVRTDASLDGSRATPKDDGSTGEPTQSEDAGVKEEDAATGNQPDADVDAGHADAGKEDAGKTDAGKVDAGKEDAGSDAKVPEGNPERCGPGGSKQCNAGQYCRFEADNICGEADKGGTCADRAIFCAPTNGKEQGFCGCDDKTYNAECDARRAGVAIAHAGPCTPSDCEARNGSAVYKNGKDAPKCQLGQTSTEIVGGEDAVICCFGEPTPPPVHVCGGTRAAKCAEGEFCDYADAEGDGCPAKVRNAEGICKPLPTSCDAVLLPVCGCDGTPYNNACGANVKGIAVDRSLQYPACAPNPAP